MGEKTLFSQLRLFLGLYFENVCLMLLKGSMIITLLTTGDMHYPELKA